MNAPRELETDDSLVQRGLYRLLNLSSDVRREEVVETVLFLLNLFLALVAYYVIKTVREPLILASGGAEMKSYAAAFQAAVLFAYIPLYGWVTRRVPRRTLNVGLVLFFIVCIEAFFLAGISGSPNVFRVIEAVAPASMSSALTWLAANINLGFVFYVWVGIFSLSVVAQFWSYANDVYQEDTGKRLFPVIAVGATAGAPVGSAAAAFLFDQNVGPYLMLQVSAGLLAVHLGLYWYLERRIKQRPRETATGEESKETSSTSEEEGAADRSVGPASGRDGGFQLIWKNRYLWWIALFFVVLNLVNTTGEYILSAFVERAAREAVTAGSTASMESYIGQFYGNFFSVVNVAAVLIQAFLVSRVLKWFGMRGMIFTLPVVALGTYGLAAFGVGLAVFRWVKTAENSTDYSLMNTTRALVWLPTSRMEKYAAKQTIDTFFVRLGDMLSAGLVFVGTTWLQFQPQQFAYTNLGLIALWMGVGVLVYRAFRRRSEEEGITTEDLEAKLN